MLIWEPKHPRAHSTMLGYIPLFLNEHDPSSAKEQFNKNYIGGWHPFDGFIMLPNGNLSYPGDPITHLLYETKFRDETIRFYEHAWIAIIQKDGSFEISRMD